MFKFENTKHPPLCYVLHIWVSLFSVDIFFQNFKHMDLILNGTATSNSEDLYRKQWYCYVVEMT